MVEAKGKGEKSVNICDMIHLVHMPEVNKLFMYKLAEVTTGKLHKSIQEYQDRVDKYKKELFHKVRRKEKKAGKKSYIDLYWFELSTFEENDWGLTTIDPWPPPLTPYFTIMPQEIIDKIAAFREEPGRVVTLEGVCSRNLKKVFALQFVKMSSNHIVGVVRETSDVREHPELEEVIEKFGINREREEERKLRYYLVKYPHLCKEFIKLFIDQVLPTVVEWEETQRLAAEKN